MFRKFLPALVISLTFAHPTASLAMGSDDSASSGDPTYVKAVEAVKKKDFKLAIVLLQDVVAKKPKNADAWNYIGYSYRKMGNFDAALGNYKKALAINPDHRGAHEYLGELYVETGRMKLAKEHLARLDGLCFFGCEEYDELKAAIKAAGG